MIMIALLAWGFLSALVAFLPKDGSSCFAITCITCYSMKSSLLHSCALGHCWVDGPMSTFFFQKSYSGHKHPWAQVISMECHLQPQRRLYREHFDMVLYTQCWTLICTVVPMFGRLYKHQLPIYRPIFRLRGCVIRRISLGLSLTSYTSISCMWSIPGLETNWFMASDPLKDPHWSCYGVAVVKFSIQCFFFWDNYKSTIII